MEKMRERKTSLVINQLMNFAADTTERSLRSPSVCCAFYTHTYTGLIRYSKFLRLKCIIYCVIGKKNIEH